MDRLLRWWSPALFVAGVGAVIGTLEIMSGSAVIGSVTILALVALGWFLSPLRRGRHVDLDAARQAADADELIVFWKPGCSVCIKLDWELDREIKDRIHWVNVWRDHGAADAVAELNGGDELTPTVITGAGERVGPSAEEITRWVRDHQP